MLRALYEYGQRHPEVVLPVGYSSRKVNVIVVLDAAGKFVGVEKPGNLTVFCPTRVITGANSQCNPLAEKASVVLGIRDEVLTEKQVKQNALLDKKFETFKSWLESGLQDVPEFQFVLDLLTDAAVLDTVRDECDAVGVKPADCVTFSVDGVMLFDFPGVKAWWKRQESGGNDDGTIVALDVVTGDVVTPQRLMKKVKGLDSTGGMAQCSLVSFDKSAFCSYGFEQNYNAPMSSDTADVCIDVLNHMIRSDMSTLIGGVKFLHWYDADLTADEEDPFDAFFAAIDGMSDEADDEDVVKQEVGAEMAAKRLLMSPLKGEIPVSVFGNRYHIVMIQGESGRAVVRRYETGSYENLYNNVKQWFDDMSLVSVSGIGYTKYCGISSLLGALLSRAESQSSNGKWDALKQTFQGMVQSCFHGGRLPNVAASRALNNLRSCMVMKCKDKQEERLYQILKLWISREERSQNKEVTVMHGLNEQHPSVAYHLGRLLAAYSELQILVKPNIGASMLQRYYAGMSQNPMLTLPQLQRMANIYMESLTSYSMRQLLSDVMDSASRGLGDVIPKSLTMEEQAYFALGYRQQVADIHRRRNELKMSKQTVGVDAPEDIDKEDI